MRCLLLFLSSPFSFLLIDVLFSFLSHCLPSAAVHGEISLIKLRQSGSSRIAGTATALRNQILAEILSVELKKPENPD